MKLATTYLGFKLRTPLVPSASPLSENLDNIKRMEDAGASAVVFHSLFEEQLRPGNYRVRRRFWKWRRILVRRATVFSDEPDFKVDPEAYVNHIAKAKAAVRIPIIGSLNGSTFGGWQRYARQIEQAGADALELNIYTCADRPGSLRRRYRDGLSYHRRVYKSAVEYPGGGEAQPIFHESFPVRATSRSKRR